VRADGTAPMRQAGLSRAIKLGVWSRGEVVRVDLEGVIAHARYTVFQMAEVAVPHDLFRRILAMIDELRPRSIARC
jgi:hypothetical protein